MRAPWVFVLLLLVAGLALAGTALLASRHIAVETVDPAAAAREWGRVRATLGAHGADPPWLRIDASGHVEPNPLAPPARPGRLSHVRVLAYRVREGRLVRADAPFWLVKLKGPAVALGLRGTGVDVAALGLTPSQLEQRGPGLVLDEPRASGDRLMVWTD